MTAQGAPTACQEKAAGRGPFRRILVAVEGNAADAHALAEALALARSQQAVLRLVYVVDARTLGPEALWTSPTRLARELRREAMAALAGAVAVVRNAGIDAEAALVESAGGPELVLAEEARRWQADLLVAGVAPSPRTPLNEGKRSARGTAVRLRRVPVLLV